METDYEAVTVKFTDKKDYQLTEQEFKAMHFFQESLALAENREITLEMTFEVFRKVADLLKRFNYQLPDPPKASSNNSMDSLGREMSSEMSKL